MEKEQEKNIEALIEKGKKKGYLSKEDTVSFFGGLNPEEADEAKRKIEDEGVMVDDDASLEEEAAEILGEVEQEAKTQPLALKAPYHPLLTPEEEQILGKKAKEGDKAAREEMIEANMGLVRHIAKKYYDAHREQLVSHQVDFSDVVSCGNEGLITAVDRFDYSKGFRFSTYACYWIEAMIKRGMTAYSKISYSEAARDKIAEIKKTQQDLKKKLEREPTGEEISKALKGKYSAKKVEEYLSYPSTVDSYEQQVGNKDDDSPLTLGDIASATSYENGENEDDEQENFNREEIEAGLKALDERERYIVLANNGWENIPKKSLEDIAKEYGFSRERARQIRNRAFAKMKKAILEYREQHN